MKKGFFLVLIIFSVTNIVAQLPNTDIWLLDIVKTKDSISLKNPVNITKRTGYDNQPAFSPTGNYLLYTSIREDKQADIYKYDLKTKLISQFTKTSTSEYSPTFMPDGKNISVVMVEPDSAQRLWQFPLSGGAPSLIMKDIDSIGYHCWISKDSLALVMITEPPTLEVVNIKTEKFKVPVNNVGRCMYLLSSEMLYYIDKKDSTKFALSYYVNYLKECKKTAIELPNEDFAITGTKEPIIITGLKTKVCATYSYQNTTKTLLDLSGYGIKKITRIAINKEGTKLAIVAE